MKTKLYISPDFEILAVELIDDVLSYSAQGQQNLYWDDGGDDSPPVDEIEF